MRKLALRDEILLQIDKAARYHRHVRHHTVHDSAVQIVLCLLKLPLKAGHIEFQMNAANIV